MAFSKVRVWAAAFRQAEPSPASESAIQGRGMHEQVRKPVSTPQPAHSTPCRWPPPLPPAARTLRPSPILLQPPLQPAPPMAAPPKRAAIIGAGRVGSTLGARLLAAGWAVMYGSRHPGSSKKLHKALHAQPAASGGGIEEAVQWAGGGAGPSAILLTVPGSALASDAACAALARSLGPSAAGQVVIDATNPLDAEGNELCWSRGHSSAEALAKCLPGDRGERGLPQRLLDLVVWSAGVHAVNLM